MLRRLAPHRRRARPRLQPRRRARERRQPAAAHRAISRSLIGRPVELSFSDWRAGDQRYYVSDRAAPHARSSCDPRSPGAPASPRSPAGWRTSVGRERPRSGPPRASGPPRPCREKRGRPGGGGVSVRLIGRRPLRLLMTADAVGGVWTYALDLAGALAAHGVETTLAVLGPAPSAQALSQALAIPQTSHRHHRPAARLDRRQPGRGRGGGARRRRARAQRAAPTSSISTARRSPPRRGSRRRSSASAIPASRPGGARSAAVRSRRTSSGARRCSRRGFRAADALVAPTAAFARMTADAYGIPPPRVVHNGRRPGAPHAPAEPAIPRASPPAGSGTRARTSRPSTAPPRASTSRCSPPGLSPGRTAP